MKSAQRGKMFPKKQEIRADRVGVRHSHEFSSWYTTADGGKVKIHTHM
jgi:hypothetical protein